MRERFPAPASPDGGGAASPPESAGAVDCASLFGTDGGTAAVAGREVSGGTERSAEGARRAGSAVRESPDFDEGAGRPGPSEPPCAVGARPALPVRREPDRSVVRGADPGERAGSPDSVRRPGRGRRRASSERRASPPRRPESVRRPPRVRPRRAGSAVWTVLSGASSSEAVSRVRGSPSTVPIRRRNRPVFSGADGVGEAGGAGGAGGGTCRTAGLAAGGARNVAVLASTAACAEK